MAFCHKCGSKKEESDPPRGLCTPCRKSRERSYYDQNRDKILAAQRAYYEENKDSILEKLRQYNKTERGRDVHDAAVSRSRQRYPERSKARFAVNNAIAQGRLEPKPCEVCAAPKAEAHHDDYSKPLEVRWLCNRHHREHHRKEKEQQHGLL